MKQANKMHNENGKIAKKPRSIKREFHEVQHVPISNQMGTFLKEKMVRSQLSLKGRAALSLSR